MPILIKIDQWLGNLFYRGIAPKELKEMSYHELKYWNDWHNILVEAEKPKDKIK